MARRQLAEHHGGHTSMNDVVGYQQYVTNLALHVLESDENARLEEG